MLKRKSFKRLFFALALILSYSSSLVYNSVQSEQAQIFNACMAINSDLPVNHSNHPCQAHYLSNQSWWAWFKGGSHSAHFHFLDLVELLHQSILKN